MGMAAAVIGAGALGAAGSVAGSVMSSKASKSAASTQAQAADQAAAMQQQQYQQARGDLLPYNITGQQADGMLNARDFTDPNATSTYLDDANRTQGSINRLLGLSSREVMANADTMLPGYQFTLDQGLKSTQNAAAARGLGVSGAALKAAGGYATGLADQTYNQNMSSRVGLLTQNMQNSLGMNTAAQGNLTNAYNRLLSTAQLGENAASQTGNLGTQTANNAGNNLTSAANASAAGQVGSANAISGGLSGVGNSAMNYLMMSKLMGSGSSGGFGPTPGTYSPLTGMLGAA